MSLILNFFKCSCLFQFELFWSQDPLMKRCCLSWSPRWKAHRCKWATRGQYLHCLSAILPRQPHTDFHLCFALAHLDQAEWSCSFTLQHVNRHHNKLFPVATTAPAVRQDRSSLNGSSQQRRTYRWKTEASFYYLHLVLSYFLNAVSALFYFEMQINS